jgi:SAM-dependent methyltransferase
MRFSFGKNWLSYSRVALDKKKIAEAREAFSSLTRGIELKGAQFLDIGFGQGLSLFLAAEAGADAFGIDVDPVCGEALEATQQFFPTVAHPRFVITSILDDRFVQRQLRSGGFDVVHSWGVLHHTGDMRTAFRNAAALVNPGGFLIISIYNRHWTSPIWRAVKYGFNHIPSLFQKGIELALYPIFYLRARSLSAGNSKLARRGMDVRHDVRDWLGGYPYEYASPTEVQRALSELALVMIRCDLTRGFTGCNEFVFQKKA